MKKFYLISVCKKLMIFILCFAGIGKVMATDVSGDINGNTTWTKANSPYVIIGNITVKAGKTLIIEAGVEVQFMNGNNTVSQLYVIGTLKAVGAISDFIRFTGGGFYQGSQRGPVTIDPISNNSVLQYVDISGLGYWFYSDYTASIIVKSNSCKVMNCNIHNIQGTALQIDRCSPMISNNNITQNTNLDVIADLDKMRYLTDNNALEIGLTHLQDMGSNDTLTSNNAFYRLLANQIVPSSKTLVINPGVEVQFANGGNDISQIMVQGTLKALGDASNYINFTGGGFYQGSQRGPITIEATSNNSVLQYVDISGLGYWFWSDNTASIIVKSNSCKVVNCNIHNIQGTALQIDRCSPMISNNQFPASLSYLDVIADLDKMRYLTDNNALEIGLTHLQDMGSNDTLTSNNAFYRLLANQIVPNSRTLTIEAGVEVQFTNGGNDISQIMVQGTLKALGDASNYINFTGGGFYQGSQRGPITIEATSNNSVLQYVNISGLGYWFNNTTNTAVLYINSSSTTVLNCNFSNNSAIAINIPNLSSPTFIRDCFFTNRAGILSNGGNPMIHECNFIGNSDYGVNNTSVTDTIDASNSFWGDLSGPKEINTNPDGSGDIVSDNVIYNPFSQTQYDCSEASALPLTLLNFKATLSGNAVTCNWQTASEVNTNYFMVQRSANGTNFSDIGKVYAAGNGNGSNSYQFTDKTPNSGANYYRLQMTDKDGRYTYSKVLPINLSLAASFVIYPNPAKDRLFVQVKRDAAEKAVVQITDMQGKILQQQSQQLTAGVTSLSFTISALANGSYILLIKGQKTEAKIFVKE